MGKFLKNPGGIYLILFTFVFISDIASKYIAEAYLKDKSVEVLPFLDLVLIYNKGIAFGLFANLPESLRLPLLIGSGILGMIVTFVYAGKVKEKFIKGLMGAIGGGACGNLYDRIVLGEVRDFIYLHYGPYYWPAFNVADASITVSVCLFLVYSLVKGRGG